MSVTEIPNLGLPVFEPGSVWLVGAGPGDPGLLTLHALNALRQADVVVYDALVGKGVLELARVDAEREFAGKRGGKPSPKQPDISRRLIELAREGKRVLRLKGGDPFVFGRGGEECLALAEAGVPFRVVPGITAGIGGLAYAGIPVTHRESGEAVTFATGHSTTGEVPDALDWAALARGTHVLVLYMALKHIGTIAQKLMDGGRGADEPVAVVNNATLPEQTVLVTTLGRAAEDVAASGIEPPALIVVGPVVNLHAVLGGR
ncbi:uroporphyrinogen-III C-methyltransferase [Azospirillum sp.]|uniref:uroporphyrinogen-III C-methyltransferase n=1 Tax=Azospirillum sp. TaxID=34012 RepID=UPI002D457A17|nr:uroporphyrinogen-III C-methyltransferase [Azospirillum sp.]HYD65214.1 uroporphyrinogen-III C-methyltransferase [Azospirillum sp.]